MTLAEEVKQLADEMSVYVQSSAYTDYFEEKLTEVCRKTVEACQGQLRVMADLAPTEHKSIYQLAIKQLRSLLPQPARNLLEEK